MHPTVLIVAVLLLHGVSGHLFQRALPYELTKHMQLHKVHKRQSDADECIEKKIEEAFKDNITLAITCNVAGEGAEEEADDDDLSQEEINEVYSVICKPECGNVFISAADDCGFFKGENATLRDIFIGLCGTNQNGDRCYEILVATEETVESQESCFLSYLADKECDCKAALQEAVREEGCCLDIFYDVVEEDYGEKPSDLYDACDVNYPSGCDNSPLAGSGFMPQVALVTLISALIFSVMFS